MEELDEYDEGEVEVGVSGQRGRGKGHPEIGHAAIGHVLILGFDFELYFPHSLSTLLALIIHRLAKSSRHANLAKQDPGKTSNHSS